MADVTLVPAISGMPSTKIDFAASGNNTVITSVSGTTINVQRMLLVATAATTVTFYDGSTALTGAITLGIGGSIILDYSGNPWFTMTKGNSFIINSSAAVQISGRVYYTQV